MTAESLAKPTAEDTGALVEKAADVLERASAGEIQAQTDVIAGKVHSDVIERVYDEAPESGPSPFRASEVIRKVSAT